MSTSPPHTLPCSTTCPTPSRYVGIGGQGPSDHPDLAKWLMEQGIDSVSLNPDSAARSNLLGLREPARAPNKDDKDGELTVKLFNC